MKVFKKLTCNFFIIIGINLFFLLSCKERQTQLVWDQSFPMIGSQSSPRVIDINHDGVDDIIMGACRNEYKPNDMAALALDGKTGHILWTTDAKDQVYGSATLVDINDDKNEDVILSGRWGYLRALDGQSGKTLWDYTYTDSVHPILKYTKYNFYNSVLIPDQNNDGVKELLIQNGGNHAANPLDSAHRYPGVLLIMNPKNGDILTADTMPDGRESYMSPLYYQTKSGKEYIIFGSGGETFNGHMYIATIKDLLNKQLSHAKMIAHEETTHGYIAPPSLADFNHDGTLDIAVISQAGKISVINGETLSPIWEKRIQQAESSNAFAVGKFNKDDTPDLFATLSRGVWPNSTYALHVCLDGNTGEIIYQDSIGCAAFASPVSYDLTKDGIDEIILSINEYDCNRGYTSDRLLEIKNKLLAINIKTHKVQPIDETMAYKNIYSTPLITDLDHDGYLDIIYGQYYSHNYDLLSFLGMRVKRVQTNIKIKEDVKWGGYMGSLNNGIYK